MYTYSDIQTKISIRVVCCLPKGIFYPSFGYHDGEVMFTIARLHLGSYIYHLQFFQQPNNTYTLAHWHFGMQQCVDMPMFLYFLIMMNSNSICLILYMGFNKINKVRTLDQ